MLQKNRVTPLITVMGNHDCLSNGYNVFERLFGPPNISFISGKYKFILFNNTIWENNNQSPKYEWLTNELADSAHFNIVLAHIPPWSDQMEGINNLVFRQIVNANNTILCLHGHEHKFTDTYYNSIHSVVAGDIDDREYYIIKLVGKQSIINRVSF